MHLRDHPWYLIAVNAIFQQDSHGLLLSFQATVETGMSLAMSCVSSCGNSQRGYLMIHDSIKGCLMNNTGNARQHGPDSRSLDVEELL